MPGILYQPPKVCIFSTYLILCLGVHFRYQSEESQTIHRAAESLSVRNENVKNVLLQHLNFLLPLLVLHGAAIPELLKWSHACT